MSDTELIRVLDDLERLLQGDLLEAGAVASWREQFEVALASADRGPDWPGIVTRAHELSAKLDTRTKALSEQRDKMGKELGLQAQGARALKGYKPF